MTVTATVAFGSARRSQLRRKTCGFESRSGSEKEAEVLLTWVQGQYASYRGMAGPVHVFSISWRTRRGDPDWTLTADLNGMPRDLGSHDDRAVLEARAETALRKWLVMIGAPVA